MKFLDWLVLAGYAALMLAVGAFYSRQNKTADDYLLGGRRMSMLNLLFVGNLVERCFKLVNLLSAPAIQTNDKSNEQGEYDDDLHRNIR